MTIPEGTKDAAIEINGRTLKLTNLDKPFWPEIGVTKRDLLRYTAHIAPILLPYLRRRAFTMHRFPNGTAAKGFWQKELPDHAPDWLARWENPDAGRGESDC